MKANPIVGQGTPLHQWQRSSQLAQLAEIDILQLVPEGARAVIIAPHPDDEVLGCGGFLQMLATAGRPMQLISVTDGSAICARLMWCSLRGAKTAIAITKPWAAPVLKQHSVWAPRCMNCQCGPGTGHRRKIARCLGIEPEKFC